MSQNIQKLCCMVIEEFYGHFFASIYSQLAKQGRSSASQLAHRCRLPLRQVKTGLATLIQLRLIYHHTVNNISTYQINLHSTYNVLRCGKLIENVQSKYGNLAAEIMLEATLLGFMTIAELTERSIIKTPKLNGIQVNGTAGNSPTMHAKSEISAIVRLLIEDGFLAHVRAAQFQSNFDASLDVELAMASVGWTTSSKGKKALAEHGAVVESEVRKRQSSDYIEHGFSLNSAYDSSDDDAYSRKRRKVENKNGSHPLNKEFTTRSTSQEHNALIGVSYRNIVTHLRDDYIATLAEKTFGRRAQQVLQAALQQLPTADLWSLENAEVCFDVSALQMTLNDLSTNIRNDILSNGHHADDSSEQVEHYTFLDVRRSLNLLSEGGFDFLENPEEDKWVMRKSNIDGFIQSKETLKLVGDRLSPPALRIVRMLIQNGKMDEKTLQETGLLGAKELRQTLAELKQLGFVDLQEVPREAQRQPNRTIFLWFHDSTRVRNILLENLYKTMTRLLQRLKFERHKLSSTLAKVERSDVRGSEDVILSAPELKVLKRLRRTEEWLLGEVARLDVSVAILRDL